MYYFNLKTASERTPNGMCKSTEILCKDQTQCILKSFLCDKELDCRDHSDEIGCSKPTITHHLLRNLTIELGGTFRIKCQATGWPHPFINWRLNWGHVCEEPRCFSTNHNGCGILTVTDARISDAGAYSCEAINSEGRVFAVPDTIVDVDRSSKPFNQIIINSLCSDCVKWSKNFINVQYSPPESFNIIIF